MLDLVFPEIKTPRDEKRIAEGDYWAPVAAGVPVDRKPGDPPVTARYQIVTHRPATEVERRLRQAGVPTSIDVKRDQRLSYAEPDDLDVKRRTLRSRRRQRTR
jgi:hypothetical protein